MACSSKPSGVIVWVIKKVDKNFAIAMSKIIETSTSQKDNSRSSKKANKFLLMRFNTVKSG